MLFHHDGYDYYWDLYCHSVHFVLHIWVFRDFWFCNYAHLPLDILFEYWIDHATFGFGFVNVMFGLSTRMFDMGVSGFATNCHRSVWCHRVTNCLLQICPLFGDLVWNNNRFVTFHCFQVCFTYIVMPHYMMILDFHLPYFHITNSALFFTEYSSTLFLQRCRLDTFYSPRPGGQRHRILIDW